LAYNLSLDFTLPYLPAFGGQLLDSQGKLALGSSGATGTIAWLDWLRTLHTLSRNGDLLAVEDHNQIDLAVQRAEAQKMVFDWASALEVYQSLWGEAQVGIAPFPIIKDPKQGDGQPAPLVQS